MEIKLLCAEYLEYISLKKNVRCQKAAEENEQQKSSRDTAVSGYCPVQKADQ